MDQCGERLRSGNRWELDSRAVSGEDAHLVSGIPIVGVALSVLMRSEGRGRCSRSRC